MLRATTNRKNHMSEKTSTGGIGFVGLLTIAFVVLKLCNVINWSWWWVLSPVWISAIIVILVLSILLAIFLQKKP